MIMFNTSKEVKLSNLQRKQTNALGIFRKTLEDLAEVNKTIEMEASIAEVQIRELQTFTFDLEKQKIANSKIIDKIKALLED